MSSRGPWLLAAGMVLSLGCGTLIGTDFDDLEPRDETGGAGGVAGTGGGGNGGTGGGGAGGAGAGGAGNGGAGNGGAGAGNGGAGAGNGGAGAGNGGAGAGNGGAGAGNGGAGAGNGGAGAGDGGAGAGNGGAGAGNGGAGAGAGNGGAGAGNGGAGAGNGGAGAGNGGAGAGNGGAGAGNGGAGAGNGGAGNGGAGAAGCPSQHGPLMVAIPTTSGGTMCIDSTEVTRSQYAEFVASAGSAQLTTQPATCTWNSSFVPDGTCTGMQGVCAGTACADHPQVCVDHCDAVAFCAWAGKRLCGSIAGSPLPFGAFADPTQSMWMNACSSGLTLSLPTNAYPYGNTFDPLACDGQQASGCQPGKCTTSPVGSHPACVAPTPAYAGVLDLSGGVWEWEDACDTGSSGSASDYCHLRGGSYADAEVFMGCAFNHSGLRDKQFPNVGFRCCAP